MRISLWDNSKIEWILTEVLFCQLTNVAGTINLRQFHVVKSSHTKRKHVFKLTNIAPDAKPASPSPTATPVQKTEFLLQADDQSSYEQWKSQLEKITDSNVSTSTWHCEFHHFHFLSTFANFDLFRTSWKRKWTEARRLWKRRYQQSHARGRDSPGNSYVSNNPVRCSQPTIRLKCQMGRRLAFRCHNARCRKRISMCLSS